MLVAELTSFTAHKLSCNLAAGNSFKAPFIELPLTLA